LKSSNKKRRNNKAPKLGVLWWVFFCPWILLVLFLVPHYIGVIRTIQVSPQSVSWPTIKGKPRWLVSYSGSTGTAVSKTGGLSSLSCRYTYKVNGVQYSSRKLTLASTSRTLTKADRKDPVVAEYKKKFRDKHGEVPRGDDHYEIMAAALGKQYEDENGLVTVYYDPNRPSRSTLKPGKVTFLDFYGAMFVLGILVLWFLWLMIQPTKIFLRKKRQRARTMIQQLTTDCPHCHQELEVSSEYLGQVVECPHCQEQLALPAG
jgi:hypothetical protein